MTEPEGDKPSNVERLVEAGVLDDTALTTEGREAINAIDLSEAEITALTSVLDKLSLNPLNLEAPSRGINVWRL